MLDWMQSMFESFAGSLRDVLPVSPFRQFLTQFSDLPYISWINWFIPVGAIVDVGLAWLSAIALFYLYSAVLRWLKAIS